MPKNVQTNHTIALTSNAGKILQGRLQQYVNWELPDLQDAFQKGRETGDQIGNINRIMEKAKEHQKHIFLLHWLHESLWLYVSQETGKFLKRWESQTWKLICESRITS